MPMICSCPVFNIGMAHVGVLRPVVGTLSLTTRVACPTRRFLHETMHPGWSDGLTLAAVECVVVAAAGLDGECGGVNPKSVACGREVCLWMGWLCRHSNKGLWCMSSSGRCCASVCPAFVLQRMLCHVSLVAVLVKQHCLALLVGFGWSHSML